MLCSALLEYLFYRITETAVNQEAKVSQSIETYQRCRQYIKEHFVQLHNLQDIAQSCLIDPAYLCRLFQRLDTQSPYQYLIHLKMAFAAEELHKPDMLIKEIAHKLGFDDAFHFSRTFKNIFGVSPKAFKNLRATHAE
jgi:AraC-like DNA-binding protein